MIFDKNYSLHKNQPIINNSFLKKFIRFYNPIILILHTNYLLYVIQKNF